MEKKESIFRKKIDLEEMQGLLQKMRSERRLSTGYENLDRILDGLRPGTVTLLAARPAMGRFSLALNMVSRISRQVSGDILIMSTRYFPGEITMRLLNIGTGVESKRLIDGNISGEDLSRKMAAFYEEKKSNILVETLTSLTLENIRWRSANVPNLQLLVVDGIERICEPNCIKEGAYEEKSAILQYLKTLALELDVPVICTAFLHRTLELRKDKCPNLRDLKKVDIPVSLPDRILFLYRERYYDPSGENTAKCIAVKNNGGEVATAQLYWEAETGRFLELWDKYDP